MIYGAAGTGKSTLINHVSRFWNDSKKLYIANTHPAVENLKRKVKAANTEFLTIKKYLNRYPKTDILFIDECSMVNNRDMVEILRNGKFELLVLVGDVYQIEAIQFGNWFNLARSFVPLKAQFELIKPYISSEELEKEVVIPKIMHLNHPSFPHCDRDKLFEAFATEGYEKASQYISNYKRKVD
jgi:hypothetical protein